MPTKSNILGFKYVSRGRNYSLIQFLKLKTKEITRNRRLLNGRDEVETIESLSLLYCFRNTIVSTTETLLDKTTKDLAELRCISLITSLHRIRWNKVKIIRLNFKSSGRKKRIEVV